VRNFTICVSALVKRFRGFSVNTWKMKLTPKEMITISWVLYSSADVLNATLPPTYLQTHRRRWWLSLALVWRHSIAERRP